MDTKVDIRVDAKVDIRMDISTWTNEWMDGLKLAHLSTMQKQVQQQ